MKKILITGAGSGLGRALALAYAKADAQICVADVNSDGANETVEQITNLGGDAFFHSCDITKQADVDKLAIALADRWKSLDMLINNAGVATGGSLESESLEQWQWVLDINVLGQVRMTKAMLPLLRDSSAPEKDIVNIASQAGITPVPGMGSYSLSKAALVSYSETAHLELVHEGIHVSVACPSFFDTNLGDSLRSDDDAMHTTLNKLIAKSGITAAEIADKIQTAVAARKFLIVTHSDGRKAHYLKRFLPIERYLKIVAGQTKKFVQKRERP